MRGVSVSQRSNRYGTVLDYFKGANDNMCVMVQIEGTAGVAAAPQIAALDGMAQNLGLRSPTSNRTARSITT